MPMDTGYLDSARKQFAYYKLLGDRTFEQLADAELQWQYNPECNSVATIVKHLWGNMLSRWTDFLGSDGEKEWRDREAEFDNDLGTRAGMLAKWEEGWACLFAALEPLKEEDLGRIVHIRNQGHTVMEAINRQLAHYPYHVGQIVHIGKMLRGTAWKSLSIPRGQSGAYNAGMFSAPKHRGHFTDGVIGHAHTRPLLAEELRRAHAALWRTVEALSPEQLERAAPMKWSALQHLGHIHLGVEAMARYLAMPRPAIAEKFGRMDRPSMSLDALKAKYAARLAEGVVPPDRFQPPARRSTEREAMVQEGRDALDRLLHALEDWREDELDTLLCPHPAMGPLTAREMVMFTVFHAEHHERSIARITA